MIRGLGLAAALFVTLAASASGAIEAPADATDLRSGIEPLATHFDGDKGQHRLLVLLSPA